MSEKKAVFFCSAVKEIDPIFNQAARDAVRAACLCGYDIVSGGTIKGTMREGTCLAVALPGGIGTLDELSETCCLAKMHIYPGKVIAFNLDGFYNAYRDQLTPASATACWTQHQGK